MGLKSKVIIFIFIFTDVVLALYLFLRGKNIGILSPSGVIAMQERDIIFFAAGLGLSVIIPILLFTFFIVWRYRADNPKAKYTPDWTNSKKIEVFRWGLMCLVIGILAVLTWKVAHTLDPYRPLDSNTKPITIQVVALQWRWLFIYPEQHIATINFVEFPEKTPVTFQLTADAPMNSFWIPNVGGQIYAMSGMVTQTHMMVDSPGEFPGSDAEISGKGFAGMKFIAKSATHSDFDTWVGTIQHSSKSLTFQEYTNLAKPSMETGQAFYTVSDKNLYNKIIMKYMEPSSEMSQMKY